MPKKQPKNGEEIRRYWRVAQRRHRARKKVQRELEGILNEAQEN